MKALILSAWEDTGGVGIGLKYALEKYTDWQVRFVHRHHNYIAYPTDIYWAQDSPRPEFIDRLFAEADVIHVMERWSAVTPFEGWRDKPLVMHHHGTEFRNDNTQVLLETTASNRAVGIVSTPDLTLIDGSLEWLPNPCDIDRLWRIRRNWHKPQRKLRIAHSPTHREIKSTDLFIHAIDGLGLDLDLIEQVTWEDCLRRKAQADLFYDQLHIGYALSGIEAMAMGIPVVSGAFDPRILDLMLRVFGYLPFYLASRDSLRQRIEQMKDPALRSAYSDLGKYHVQKWHNEERVAKQLIGIYERAMSLR